MPTPQKSNNLEYKGTLAIEAADKRQWRKWLEENHVSRNSVWLIIYKKKSGIQSIDYNEAVDEALCYGWIDSLPNKRDAKSYYQYFSKRNPKSNWSKVNKEKVAYLIKEKRMAKAGYEMIDTAKQTGTWDALNDVDNLVVPKDMMEVFDTNPKAFDNWNAFPDSTKRGILEWIFNAKRVPTRKKRIDETVRLAALNKRANQYNP